MEGLNTDSRLFTAKHFKLSSQFEWFPYHTHFFTLSVRSDSLFPRTVPDHIVKSCCPTWIN
jgi:hypothetical protein